MTNQKLENLLNHLLEIHAIKDYAPNGLQVEGRSQIKRVVTGVTASMALIEKAIELEADAIIVHHGYFWNSESAVITGMKQRRIKALLDHNINLYAYHLPLDVHPELGNNALLAQSLGITLRRGLEPWNKKSVAVVGKFETPISGADLAARIEQVLGRAPLHLGATGAELIRSIALCSGGGQSYMQEAANQGIDAFLTGEASEQNAHIAAEMGMHFFAAGHHATERFGVQALASWLTDTHAIEARFIDIPNPI